MKKFQEKNRWRNIVQSKPVLVLLVLLLIAFVWSVFGLMIRMQETSKNKKIEENKIFDLMQRRDTLSVDIDSLKTEKGVEENIREKFGLTKDGEGMIIIVDDQKESNSLENEVSSNAFLSFLKKIFK